MPYPALGTERARPDLAETLEAFDLQSNMANMVALQIMPLREVQYNKGTFGRLTGKQLLGKASGVPGAAPGFEYQRASRTDYNRDDMAFTEDSWETTEFGLEGLVDERESRAYRDYFDHAAVVTRRVSNLLATSREVRVAQQIFNVTTLTTAGVVTNIGSTAANQWNNPTTSDPVGQVKAARIAVWKRTGLWPNAVVMNALAFEHLIATDAIRTRVHAQGAGSPDRASLINREIVAQAFNVDEVIIGAAMYDPTNPNAAYTPTPIWSEHCAVFVKARGTDLANNCFGRTFHWAIDDSMPNGYVEEYRDPKKRGNIIRVRQEEQQKLLDVNCVQLLQAVYNPAA